MRDLRKDYESIPEDFKDLVGLICLKLDELTELHELLEQRTIESDIEVGSLAEDLTSGFKVQTYFEAYAEMLRNFLLNAAMFTKKGS